MSGRRFRVSFPPASDTPPSKQIAGAEADIERDVAAHRAYLLGEGGKRLEWSGKRISKKTPGASCLTGALLMGAMITDSHFDDVDFYETDFSGADLTGCDFDKATNLSDQRFGAANVGHAKFSRDFRFASLDALKELSGRAEKMLLTLLASCATIVILTLLTPDTDLVRPSSFVSLPLLGMTVSVRAFYYLAPLLLLVLYSSFLSTLLKLWSTLRELPQNLPNNRFSFREVSAYPNFCVIPFGTYWPVFRHRNQGEDEERGRIREMVRWERRLIHVVAWGLVPLTVAWVWFRYLPSQDITGSVIHASAFAIAVLLARNAYARMLSHLCRGLVWVEHSPCRAHLVDPRRSRRWSPWSGGISLSVRRRAGAQRDATAKAHESASWVLGPQGMVFNSDCVEFSGTGNRADLHPLKPRTRWIVSVPVLSLVVVALLSVANTYGPVTYLGCRDELSRISDPAESYFPPLCRLVTADLTAASLKGADLHGHRLHRAIFAYASLEGADLERAQLSAAYLSHGDLQGANLKDANLDYAVMWEADLRGAKLKEASMAHADLRGADLRGARLQGVDLGTALLTGALLDGAVLCGATFDSNLKPAGVLLDGTAGADKVGSFLEPEEVAEYEMWSRADRTLVRYWSDLNWDTAGAVWGIEAAGLRSLAQKLDVSYAQNTQVAQIVLERAIDNAHPLSSARAGFIRYEDVRVPLDTLVARVQTKARNHCVSVSQKIQVPAPPRRGLGVSRARVRGRA